MSWSDHKNDKNRFDGWREFLNEGIGTHPGLAEDLGPDTVSRRSSFERKRTPENTAALRPPPEPHPHAERIQALLAQKSEIVDEVDAAVAARELRIEDAWDVLAARLEDIEAELRQLRLDKKESGQSEGVSSTKLTKQQLKQIIKEELGNLNEADPGRRLADEIEVLKNLGSVEEPDPELIELLFYEVKDRDSSESLEDVFKDIVGRQKNPTYVTDEEFRDASPEAIWSAIQKIETMPDDDY